MKSAVTTKDFPFQYMLEHQAKIAIKQTVKTKNFDESI